MWCWVVSCLRSRDLAKGGIPQFPWPPPVASATQVVPRNLLTGSRVKILKDVDELLTSALNINGYVEKSYYAVPQGFAIVTRIEQIELDGRSKTRPARWSTDPSPLTEFSISAYIRALFTANPGYYRIIVFVVTNVPFTQSDRQLSRSEGIAWLRAGLNILPESIGAEGYTPDVICTALIYEFEQRGGQGSVSTRILLPSRLDAQTHLNKSGLLRSLGGQ